MIAYDALLAADKIAGNKWQEICFRAMIHGGSNQSTRPVATGAVPPNFVVPRKMYFKHTIKIKLLPPKMFFPPKP